jgi:hypothetical protein
MAAITQSLWPRHSPLHLFIAGAIAVLVFHQGWASLMYVAGFSPNPPFAFRPTQPLGVPQIWSNAFWGGIWGIVYGLVAARFPDRGPVYWIGAFLFGALALTLFGRLVLAPLRGQPINWDLIGAWRGFLINGVWGLGTAALLRWRP